MGREKRNRTEEMTNVYISERQYMKKGLEKGHKMNLEVRKN